MYYNLGSNSLSDEQHGDHHRGLHHRGLHHRAEKQQGGFDSQQQKRTFWNCLATSVRNNNAGSKNIGNSSVRDVFPKAKIRAVSGMI
jgi:hypothetical protein